MKHREEMPNTSNRKIRIIPAQASSLSQSVKAIVDYIL